MIWDLISAYQLEDAKTDDCIKLIAKSLRGFMGQFLAKINYEAGFCSSVLIFLLLLFKVCTKINCHTVERLSDWEILTCIYYGSLYTCIIICTEFRFEF